MIKKILNFLFGKAIVYRCHSCQRELADNQIKHNKYTKQHIGCGGYVTEVKD